MGKLILMGSHSPIKKGTPDTVTWGSGLWGNLTFYFCIVTCWKNNHSSFKSTLSSIGRILRFISEDAGSSPAGYIKSTSSFREGTRNDLHKFR